MGVEVGKLDDWYEVFRIELYSNTIIETWFFNR